MSKALLASLASTIRLLPFLVDPSVMLNNPTPSLHPHYRRFTATTGRSALLPGMRYSHSLLFATHASSFTAPLIGRPLYRARSSTVPCESLDRDHATYTPNTTKAACRLHPL